MTTDTGMEEREMLEAACEAYADASGYYVKYHRGLSSPSADSMRKGMRAAIAVIRSTPPTTAAPSGREDGSRDSSLLSGSVTVNDATVYVEALKEIVAPIEYMQKRAAASGERLDGRAAVILAKDAEYLRGIAERALESAPPSGDRTELPHGQRPIETQGTQGERG